MGTSKVDPAIEVERRRQLVVLQDVACAEYAHEQHPELSVHDLIFSTADNLVNDYQGVCACRECAAMEEARQHLFPELYRA